jgi:hypothetical protein
MPTRAPVGSVPPRMWPRRRATMLEWQGIEFRILKLKLHFCTAYRVVGVGVGRHVIKDDFGGKLPSGSPFRLDVADVVRTSARVHVYPVDAVLPADGFLPSADAVKTASTRTRPCPRGRISLPFPFPPSPPLPSPPLPSPLSLPPLYCPHGRGNKIK